MRTPNQETLRHLFLAGVIGSLLTMPALAGTELQSAKPWKIPARYHERKNRAGTDRHTLIKGLRVYRKNCASCHGKRGKGDGPAASGLTVHPQNLRDKSRMGTFTDGDLFYMIRKGRKPMPSFRATLKKDDIWQVIRFIRTFTPHLKVNAKKKKKPWFEGPLPKLDQPTWKALSSTVEKLKEAQKNLASLESTGCSKKIVLGYKALGEAVEALGKLEGPAPLRAELKRLVARLTQDLAAASSRAEGADAGKQAEGRRKARARLQEGIQQALARYSPPKQAQGKTPANE